jgi:2-haloacid dehalogenase
MHPRAILFDAYGTLFDVNSVSSLAEELFPGRGEALSRAWRAKQLEYTWLRTLSGQWRDFWGVTQDALGAAAGALGLALGAPQREALMQAYLSLAPFPENLEVLKALRARHFILGVLSNGTGPMLQAAIASAGMQGLFAHVLSADAVRRYKTDRSVYQLGLDAVSAGATDILFVSSNGWDAIGATWFGYTAFWVNRTGVPPDELGALPAGSGRSLRDLLDFLDA